MGWIGFFIPRLRIRRRGGGFVYGLGALLIAGVVMRLFNAEAWHSSPATGRELPGGNTVWMISILVFVGLLVAVLLSLSKTPQPPLRKPARIEPSPKLPPDDDGPLNPRMWYSNRR